MCKYRMRMLWDPFPRLPYSATVPWPQIHYQGQWDWIESVALVETWLNASVGPHWACWCWSMYDLDRSDLCSVRFARDCDATLFLLRWG